MTAPTVSRTWAEPYRHWGGVSSKVLSVMTGKGGTGKTSITTSLAGLLSANGRRVCVVDLDPQGHCAGNLGLDPDRDDRGAGLLSALLDPDGTPAKVMEDITVEAGGVRFERADLALVCGGEKLAHAGTIFAPGLVDDGTGHPTVTYDADALLRLRTVLGPLTEIYDLIILDCPPGEAYLQLSALAASRFVLVPTSSDDRSIEAVATVAQRFAQIRGVNDDVELLGLVLFAVGRSESAVRRRALEYVQAVMGESVVVFETYVRDVRAAADACRHEGVLPHELELLARERPSQWPASAASLADDYDRLSFEVLSARRSAVTAHVSRRDGAARDEERR